MTRANLERALLTALSTGEAYGLEIAERVMAAGPPSVALHQAAAWVRDLGAKP